MNLFHRHLLHAHGMSDEQIDQAVSAGLNWGDILALLLKYGLPALLAFIQALLNPTPAPTPPPA